MPVLHLPDVPRDIYDDIKQLANSHARPVEAEAVHLLRQGLLQERAGCSQAALLADLRQHSFTPPAGSPDSVALLREDRER
jgi:plasmid stability protein